MTGSELGTGWRAGIATLRGHGIVPVVELAEVAHAEPMFEALSAAGLPVAEVTLRTVEGLEAIRRLAAAFPGSMVGAGTVRSKEDAARVIDAGASFVVSPGTDTDVVSFCAQQDILVMPGVCTPTEVQAALRAGAQVLKFFPAEPSGGVPFLRALCAPFRDVHFVPTGGINPGNLADYLKVPQVDACGGSWMVPPSLLAAGNFAQVGALAAEAVAIVAEVRQGG